LRGDARVLLLSLAFMATGGFMLLHAIGTHEVLFTQSAFGFQVAISVGLLVSCRVRRRFGLRRPTTGFLGPWLIRNRGYLRAFHPAGDGRVVCLDRRRPAAARGAEQ